MNFISRWIDKFYIKQWSIGLCNLSVEDLIRNRQGNPRFTWLQIENKARFFADPFIVADRNNDGYHLLFEDYTESDRYGKIAAMKVNEKFEPVWEKVILDTGSHLSYPFIFSENGKAFVMPEAGASGKITVYEWDEENVVFYEKRVILDLPLVDGTLLNYGGKYWLFGTMRGKEVNRKLYIFYADQWEGPYTAHPMNPVKDTFAGSRPAGHFIMAGGILYRPAQNSTKHYGESILIQKVNLLTETLFEEEFYMELKPHADDPFHIRMHTINSVNGVIVVDGLRRHFAPLSRIRNAFTKKENSKYNG